MDAGRGGRNLPNNPSALGDTFISIDSGFYDGPNYENEEFLDQLFKESETLRLNLSQTTSTDSNSSSTNRDLSTTPTSLVSSAEDSRKMAIRGRGSATVTRTKTGIGAIDLTNSNAQNQAGHYAMTITNVRDLLVTSTFLTNRNIARIQ